jgi:hypothetical protein
MQHVPVAVLAACLVAAPPSNAPALAGISRNDQQPFEGAPHSEEEL